MGWEAEVDRSRGGGEGVCVEFRSGVVAVNEKIGFLRRLGFPCWACDVWTEGAAEEEVVEYGEGACCV